jgi:predicted nuclease of restriction endonuclease-like (RecB) superfamily
MKKKINEEKEKKSELTLQTRLTHQTNKVNPSNLEFMS